MSKMPTRTEKIETVQPFREPEADLRKVVLVNVNVDVHRIVYAVAAVLLVILSALGFKG